MAAVNAAAPPRILCVDDDVTVLKGLALHLGRDFEFRAAGSGAEALAKLVADGPFAVIVSDMRMPGMDGATLLTRARQIAPDTVRLLLTGYAGVEAAIGAVNNGQIFRFLTKPCPPDLLRRAVSDGVEQHRLLTSERELIERTLRGAVQALSEVLALTDPDAFGRAGRVQRIALALADQLAMQPRWPLELAALLSQIGTVSLPPGVVKKLRYGDTLTTDERVMVARLPDVTDKLLAPIPRLESVREILKQTRRPESADRADSGMSHDQKMIQRSAAILRLADDFDLLESQGLSAAAALSKLRARGGGDEPLLAALEVVAAAQPADRLEVRELPLRLLQVGMVLAEDLVNRSGLLLAPRGSEITASFVERARNFQPGAAREPVRVMLRINPAPAPAASTPPAAADSKPRQAA